MVGCGCTVIYGWPLRASDNYLIDEKQQLKMELKKKRVVIYFDQVMCKKAWKFIP